MRNPTTLKVVLAILVTVGTLGTARLTLAQQTPSDQPPDPQYSPDGQSAQSPPYSPDQQKPPAAHYPPEAQQPSDEQYPPPEAQPPAPQDYPPVRQHVMEPDPRALDALRQMASSKTEFTLDHSMLVFASKLDSDNDDLRRVIAGVSGISVHRFHFPGPDMYDAAALNSVKREYRAAGWKQLVNNHAKDGGPGGTRLWVRFENNAISDVAILLAKADSVNFIVVSGSISPLDLIHLGGHFGIPKIEGGVLVPNSKPHS
jgi:type IV secretory pathway VirB10-like protein